VDEAHVSKARALQELARGRGQSLAQMALAWVLRDGVITSVLIGASSVEQVEQNVAALRKLGFSPDELARIDAILG
jgi:L-glyceraldehyde 3-phosphate reductase